MYFCGILMKKKVLPYRDPFGYPIWAKRTVIFWFGIITWYRCNRLNKLIVLGGEHLKTLPNQNVLFVSNHQTYFMDVASMYLVFSHAKHRIYDRADRFWPFINPKINLFFIAAKETMKSGLLPRALSLAGSVSIKRTWREAGKEVSRNVDPRDLDNIKKAIQNGWVITFPQGTTKPYVPGRRGTAHIIKQLSPVVVPVVIDGYRRAFDKKGLRTKKRGSTLTMRFKEPMAFDAQLTPQEILDQIMDAIEQSPKHHGIRTLEPSNRPATA